jgi:hypothetical protein
MVSNGSTAWKPASAPCARSTDSAAGGRVNDRNRAPIGLTTTQAYILENRKRSELINSCSSVRHRPSPALRPPLHPGSEVLTLPHTAVHRKRALLFVQPGIVYCLLDIGHPCTLERSTRSRSLPSHNFEFVAQCFQGRRGQRSKQHHGFMHMLSNRARPYCFLRFERGSYVGFDRGHSESFRPAGQLTRRAMRSVLRAMARDARQWTRYGGGTEPGCSFQNPDACEKDALK